MYPQQEEDAMAFVVAAMHCLMHLGILKARETVFVRPTLRNVTRFATNLVRMNHEKMETADDKSNQKVCQNNIDYWLAILRYISVPGCSSLRCYI